jgi:hypothetical protein
MSQPEDYPVIIGQVQSATNQTPIVVATERSHGLNDADEIKIRGIIGNEAANGSFFVRVNGCGPSNFELFTDPDLSKAVPGVGNYQSGGTVIRPLPSDYAIVVGINGYADFKPLRGPEADAARFYNWLISPTGGFLSLLNIDLIRSDLSVKSNIQPTLDALKRVFRRYADPAFKKEDHRIGRRLYIFLSGHGITPALTTFANVEIAGLLMANASASFPDHIVGHLYADWFRNAAAFDELVLFMDCCRDLKPNVPPSGPVTPPVYSDRSGKVRFFYAMATEVDSQSWEQPLGTPPEPRGVFSFALMEALNTRTICDEKGQLTGEVLGAHLTQRVPELRKGQFAKIATSQFQDSILFATNRNPSPELRVTFDPTFYSKTIELVSGQDVVASHLINSTVLALPVQKGIYRLRIPGVRQTDLFKIDGTQEIVDVNFN